MTTNKQKKKNRNSRDSYGRLLANGWHLEVSRAEININNDGIPIVLSADIHGCDYHGSCFSQTMIPPTQLETRDKRTETHASDCVSRQAAIDEIRKWKRYETTEGLVERIENLPSAQPDDDRLEKCRFEYINACKIVARPTPDTSKSDIYDAYAVIKALHPIFGDVEF